MLHAALVNEQHRCAWSAPTWKLMLDTYEQHRHTLEPVTARISREEKRIELVNGSVIEYWSSDDPSAGRGRKYHIWAADESQRQKRLASFLRGSVRPCLADYRGTLWVLGTANGEGSEFHDYYLDCKADEGWFVAHGSLDQNPYIHPDEIAQMRRDLGPELAAQELDSLWVRIDGVTPLVRKMVWDELYRETELSLPNRVLALDGSISGDMTAIVGVGYNSQDDSYYTNYDEVVMVQPDLITGEIDYAEVERVILKMWATGRYKLFAYDPYQAVSLVQRLKQRGIKAVEVNQNSARLKADSHFKQLLTEGRYFHPDHPLLTQHMLDATLKFSGGDYKQVRIIKSSKNSKVDLAVALSMALWALHSSSPRSTTQYTPAVDSNRVVSQLPQPKTTLPPHPSQDLLKRLLEHNPWTNS